MRRPENLRYSLALRWGLFVTGLITLVTSSGVIPVHAQDGGDEGGTCTAEDTWAKQEHQLVFSCKSADGGNLEASRVRINGVCLVNNLGRNGDMFLNNRGLTSFTIDGQGQTVVDSWQLGTPSEVVGAMQGCVTAGEKAVRIEAGASLGGRGERNSEDQADKIADTSGGTVNNPAEKAEKPKLEYPVVCSENINTNTGMVEGVCKLGPLYDNGEVVGCMDVGLIASEFANIIKQGTGIWRLKTYSSEGLDGNQNRGDFKFDYPYSRVDGKTCVNVWEGEDGEHPCISPYDILKSAMAAADKQPNLKVTSGMVMINGEPIQNIDLPEGFNGRMFEGYVEKGFFRNAINWVKEKAAQDPDLFGGLMEITAALGVLLVVWKVILESNKSQERADAKVRERVEERIGRGRQRFLKATGTEHLQQLGESIVTENDVHVANQIVDGKLTPGDIERSEAYHRGGAYAFADRATWVIAALKAPWELPIWIVKSLTRAQVFHSRHDGVGPYDGYVYPVGDRWWSPEAMGTTDQQIAANHTHYRNGRVIREVMSMMDTPVPNENEINRCLKTRGIQREDELPDDPFFAD